MKKKKEKSEKTEGREEAFYSWPAGVFCRKARSEEKEEELFVVFSSRKAFILQCMQFSRNAVVRSRTCWPGRSFHEEASVGCLFVSK